MSNQSPSKPDVTQFSVTDDNNLIGFKQIKTFEWTTRLEKCLLLNMARLKPSGKSNAPLLTLFFCYIMHQGCMI